MRDELRRAFDLTSDFRKELGLALPDAATFSAAIDRLARSANAPEAGVWPPDRVAELWHALFDLEDPLSAFVAWHGEGTRGAPAGFEAVDRLHGRLDRFFEGSLSPAKASELAVLLVAALRRCGA
jgi:hypothetical protein